MSSIRFEQVRKSFGDTQVVKGLDLAVDEGEFLVFVGPSGCGKTTSLRMLAGLEPVSGGDIMLRDRKITREPARNRDMAMVFQNYALYPHMTVAENIGFALKLRGVGKAALVEQVGKAATMMGIDHLLDRHPKVLSGGQRQRVAVCRAIVRQPSVFLFDEPLSNLDPQLRTTARAEIRDLQRRLGTTSVYVTHDQIEAMTMADRIVVMHAGQVEQIGTPEELYDRPATTFVAGFIGAPAMNLFDAALVASLPQGAEKMTIGIRPEEILVTSQSEPGALKMMTKLVEVIGSEALVHGEVDGTRIVVRCPRALAPKAGDTSHIRLPMAALHFFDPSTGKRIAFPGMQ